MLWMGLGQVSVQGLQVQGSHTLKIPNSVQRLNYGTVFKSGKGLVLSNEYWRQTYEIVLPKVSSKVNLSSECMNLLTKDCILFTKVIDQIKDVELKTYLEFKHISEFLAINVPFIPLSNRVKKSLLPFVGDLSKNLFGTATMDDVNILKQHVNELIKNSRGVNNFIKLQSHHFASFMADTKDRFDNIEKMVVDNYDIITNVSQSITNQLQNFQLGFIKLTGIYYSYLEDSMTLIQQYSNFKQAVSQLVEGKLSPELISKQALRTSMHEISNILTKEYTNFYLTMRDPEYYYKHGKFVFGRFFNTIYLTLKFPISHEKFPLQLNQVISMPVPVNESSNHATHLLDLPEFIAITSHQQYYITLEKADIASCHDHQVHLCNFNKALIPVTQQSCIISLFANDKQMVNKLCDFRFRENLLNPTAIELSASSTLIYNTFNLVVDCPNNKTVIHGCSMCVVQLPCRCSITTQYWHLPPRLEKCQLKSQIKIFHSVNLALLQQFFNDSKLLAIQANTMFSSSLHVQIPNFEIYKHDFQERLVADSQLHFSMKKMAQATKRDEKIFQTLSEPLLSGDIQLSSTWPTSNDILTYISFILAISASLVCIMLFLKHRQLMAMMTMMNQIQYTKAFETNYIFEKTTTESPINIIDSIKENITWDHLIFAVNMILLMLCISLVIQMRDTTKCGTTIILELTSGSTCVMIPLLTLSLCPSLLEISPPSSISNVFLNEWPSRILKADWTNFKVTNKLQYSTIEIPTGIKLSWMNRYRVMKVMRQPYMAYILLKHGNITMPIPNTQMQKCFHYFKN